MMRREAAFSSDGRYRYWLLRVWNVDLPVVTIFGVNPSVAGAEKDDPTIRKDTGFAARHDYGGLLKLNLAAFVATDPRACRKALDPFGPENSVMFMSKTMSRFRSTDVWFCWGRNGWAFAEQAKQVALAFPLAKCFGKNPDGTPRHTLMLPYATPLEPYWGGARGMF